MGILYQVIYNKKVVRHIFAVNTFSLSMKFCESQILWFFPLVIFIPQMPDHG